jgi:hypothetical protein
MESPGAQWQYSKALIPDAPSETRVQFRSILGKIFNFVPGNGARNVSVRSHSWIARRSRAQRPSVLCHDLFNGVIKWIKTQDGIALTQETGPGM